MPKKLCLGVDVGSISTKGAILDENGTLLAGEYLWTQGDPVGAVKRLINLLSKSIPSGAKITSVGTTGSARRLIGAMLEADAVKNEITAHAVGTLSRHPEVKTIIEIGGQDSKLILIRGGVVTDYAMNTLCAAGTGAFLSSQAGRLNLQVNELGDMALRSVNPAKIAARCTVFAESDLVHKAQTGYSKEDLVAGLCKAVAGNYLSNVGKGKEILAPVIFQGGVSRNKGVRAALEQELGIEVLVDDDGHLMGAVGAALLSRGKGRTFDPAVSELEYKTGAYECSGCSNHCEILAFYREGNLIDIWGGRCERGQKEYLPASAG